MIERAFVYVAGPAGSGKTTFIESMLRAACTLLCAARCVRDDTRLHARETAPKKHPELRRYREAGATSVALFTFPKSDIDSDTFFTTDLMADYSQGVVLEGDNPLQYADLSVFVAPAPGPEERLFERRLRDRAGEQQAGLDAIERLIREPDGVAKFLGVVVGSTIVEFAQKTPKLMSDARSRLVAAIAAARKTPPPKPTWYWAISDAFSGVERAHLVVVNVRNDTERRAGEQLLADVGRLRKKEQLFKDIIGFRGGRAPITAVVADLSRPEDGGRKKALARVERVFRSRAQ
jgi:energy-coupling factor transporter ATP-binding protein EcfA2